jgi:replicative DNA helicase
VSGRQVPFKERAERDALGSVLLDPVRVHELMTLLVADDFYIPAHREIYEAMRSLANAGTMIDIGLLEDELKRRGAWRGLEVAHVKLVDLANSAGSPVMMPHYCALISEASKARAYLTFMAEASAALMGEGERGVLDGETLFPWIEQQILAINRARGPEDEPYSQLVTAALEDLEEQSRRPPGLIPGVPSGITKLDELTGGWQPEHLIVVAARPGVGKTSFAVNTCALHAAKLGIPTQVFSMEMGKHELTQRHIGHDARINIKKKLRDGSLNKQDWAELWRASGLLKPLPISIDDRGGLKIDAMVSKIRRFESNLPKEGVDPKRKGLVIIDYLQLARGDSAKESREREVAEISRGLKSVAKETKLPIIAVSQLNRGLENRTEKRPNLSDLRESGAIEQDADEILFLYRADYHKVKNALPGMAEAIMAKNRHGPPGTVYLSWVPQYTSFENPAHDYVPPEDSVLPADDD